MEWRRRRKPLRFIRENPCSSVAGRTALICLHPWLKARPASVAQSPPGSRSHSSHYSGPSVVTSCHFIAFRIGSILSTIKPSWKTRTVPVDCETAMAIAPVDLEISAAAQ